MPSSARKITTASAAVLALACPFTAHEEGLRLKTYLDVGGVPTICYGDAEPGLKMGEVRTLPQCTSMLYIKLGVMNMALRIAVNYDMPVQTEAALTSWTYNVGIAAMRKSTLVKKASAGDLNGACHELPKWKYAAGKPVLLGRRNREMKMCLEGLHG